MDVQLCEQKSIADEPTHYNEMVLSELLMLAYYGVYACIFVYTEFVFAVVLFEHALCTKDYVFCPDNVYQRLQNITFTRPQKSHVIT